MGFSLGFTIVPKVKIYKFWPRRTIKYKIRVIQCANLHGTVCFKSIDCQVNVKGLRMNKKSIFCLALSCCSMLGWSGLYGQHAFEAEIRGGIALFDLNPHPGDFLKGNQGWGSKADAVLWYSIDIQRRLKPRIGIGYTNFYYWDVDLISPVPQVLTWPASYDFTHFVSTSHYLSIRYGAEVNAYKRKYFVNLNVSHYILAHRALQGFNQMRSFMNVDVGLSIKLNERYSLTLNSPFSIQPIVQNVPTGLLLPVSTGTFDSFIEMNGLLLGVKRSF